MTCHSHDGVWNLHLFYPSQPSEESLAAYTDLPTSDLIGFQFTIFFIREMESRGIIRSRSMELTLAAITLKMTDDVDKKLWKPIVAFYYNPWG